MNETPALKKISILGAILKDNKPLCFQTKKSKTTVRSRQTKQYLFHFVFIKSKA